MAPKLPGALSLFPDVPPYLGALPPQKPTQVCPLVETGGEFGPIWIHKTFSLLELRQIKQDLGSYTDDPGKYIDTFQHITLAFDLTWKDIMVIFSQTLFDPEHTRVFKEAQRYATGLHMSSNRNPVGETAVPSSNPNWNYNDPEHIWERDHFLICVKAGLKAAQQKVISYARVSAITQESSENPIAFLERLKEALQKFTNLDLDSYKGQVILKDKFLSQCASDIRIKLQQLQQQDPPSSLDEMVQIVIFYNREQERAARVQEREKRKETRHAQMLATQQGSPMANPESLKDKARGKCLICRQAGHWAK